MAQQGLPVIQGPDPLGGLRLGLQGLVQGFQQRQAAQQVGQLFPNLNLQGITNPQALQAATQLGLLQQQIAGRAPTAFKIEEQLIDDPKSPTKFSVIQFNQAGQRIGRRFATQEEVLSGVPEAAVAKPTVAKIEKDVIDLQSTLGELRAIEEQFNPDFFTFRGKGKAFFTALAEKAEIPVGKAAQTFLRDRAKFFADSKRVFLKFRKFITGVAGGIEEFREIAKATIDPEKDSPTQFRAKFESMRDNAIRTSNLLLAIRNSGLEPSKTNIKSVLSVTPLGNIPLQVSPNATLETLGIQQPDKLVISPFRQDDVPTAVSPRTGETLIFKNGRWQPKR